MKRARLMQIALSTVIIAFAGYAHAQQFTASLNGYEEIGGLGAGETGAILSNGTGTVQLDVGDLRTTYQLTYSGFTVDVQQAHIHFGKEHVAGGVIVFFCTNLGNGPPGTPTCPLRGGTVTGTWTADSVVGPEGQNIGVGDYGEFVLALQNDTAYANIHTEQFPAGEIRGQVLPAPAGSR